MRFLTMIVPVAAAGIALSCGHPAAAQEVESSTAASELLEQDVPLGRKVLEEIPQEICRVIAYENAELISGFFKDTYSLSVAGEKPWLNMEIELRPLIYVEQPEYWAIEVVGCLDNVGLPATSPYTVDLWVTNFMGKKGVEVVGANKSEPLDKP